ncbi:hypothetical protein NFI96_008508, partial [Prochilodus magdalenae]
MLVFTEVFDSFDSSSADSTNSSFDPCSVYSVLDNDWRRTGSVSSSYDDTLVEWSGWYRLYLQGKSSQIPESDYCWHSMFCGGYTALLLGGSHPQPQDGIVTREIYGTHYSSVYGRLCNSYRSKLDPADLGDPCNNYTALDQPWRGTNVTGPSVCDYNFNWIGWYRLLYYGMNIRMPESCVNEYRCGTSITLWLNGPHPQIQDGVVTFGVCGSWSSNCCYYSFTIQVKACPRNYYVYEFVRPTPYCSAYCADVNTITPVSALTPVNSTATPADSTNSSFDPCSVYSVLDNDWRRTGSVSSSYDDTLVEWSGWYRLYLQGKSTQIPESDWCWHSMFCGGYTALLLGGSHPQPQDGIVTREIYGTYYSSVYARLCNSYRSNSIQVKACPGNYYVYRLVKPSVSLPMPTYCAADLSDPCNNYTALDQPWRGTNVTGPSICDTSFNWIGWYRLLYYGMNIRMPESCVNEYRCGTNITLWLNGPHPQIQDGVVTFGVCGSWSSYCCYYSFTIRVKACPGNYYVYEFVRPTPYCSAYCADVTTITPVNPLTTANSTATPESLHNATSDPCNVYRVLYDDWRATSSSYYTSVRGFDDTLVEWSGWYRLYLQGKSAQIPESNWCWSYMTCGGYSSLLLGGSHPLPQDGIVIREVYGTYVYTVDSRRYNSYRSKPIQVKACPGNYYVYRLLKPAVSIPMPTYCAVAFDNHTYDPCNNYTALNQPWRGTNETGGSFCDSNFISTGWYRLLYNGMNIRMPESCVKRSRCGTDITLWLNGSHPQIQDGIVTRGVCGNSGSDCCYFSSTPIRVKSCPGNYYVYEFVRPSFCNSAYCADPNITVSEDCKDSFTSKCGEDLFNKLENITAQVLPPQVVTKYLDMVLNAQDQLLKVEAASPDKLASIGNTVLNRTEKLVSTLVKPTETTDSVNISLNGLGSAAAAFMSFTSMATMLKPSFFSTSNNTKKTMMSMVVSATLPKTTNTKLTTPVNFTLEHITELDPNGTLSCVYWNNTEWIVDGCELLQTNISHTVCSCVHLSTFALIMQVNPPASGDNVSEQEAPGVSYISVVEVTAVVGKLLSGKAPWVDDRPEILKALDSVGLSWLTCLCNVEQGNSTLGLADQRDPVSFSTLLKSSSLSLICECSSTDEAVSLYNESISAVLDTLAPLKTRTVPSTHSSPWFTSKLRTLKTSGRLLERLYKKTGLQSDPLLELLSMVAVGVELLFLSLSLLTFALCRQNLKVNVVPRINLCISLFLAHLLFILRQKFLQYIRADQLMCAALAGVLHFLFLSAFVWMFFEAVLLLISVKNLTKIRSMQRNVLGWKCLIVIGYVIPLVVVGVSVGLFPGGYGSEQCWIKTDRNFVWSFLGPVCFIIIFNFIFFIVIIITMRNTMAKLNSESSQIKRLRTLIFKTLIQIVILGCPWILGFFTQGSKVLEIVFLFLNSQQGTFIFLVYCVLNQE